MITPPRRVRNSRRERRKPCDEVPDGADRKAKPTITTTLKKSDDTPGLDPMADIRYMEVMIGSQRQFMLFNRPGDTPVVATQDDASTKATEAVARWRSKSA